MYNSRDEVGVCHTFTSFYHTLRWNSVTATDPNLFQAPFRAGIKIDAYQMEPLRKALRLPRVNLFIADDTGLGKTIGAESSEHAVPREWRARLRVPNGRYQAVYEVVQQLENLD